MFEYVIFHLLRGEFICRVTHPEAFDYLADEGRFHEADGYLGRIGRRIATTSQQGGYYLAFVRIGDTERKIIKGQYQEIKNILRPTLHFFQVIMRAMEREDLLLLGAVLEKAQIMSQIDRDDWLRNELQTVAALFGTTPDGSQRTMLDRLMRKLVDAGYLVQTDTERGLYRVTSKIEYLNTIIAFIIDNEEALKGEFGDDPEPPADGPTLL